MARKQRAERFYQQPLTEEQAFLCIFALQHVCHCRCAGILHGRNHAVLFAGEAVLFDALESDVPESLILAVAQGKDPHKVLAEYLGESDNDEDEDE